MNLRELIIQAHMAELERKQRLVESIAFPTGILTGLVAALVTSITSLSRPFDVWEWFATALAGVAGVAIAIGFIFLCRAQLAHTYDYPANIGSVASWYASTSALGYSSLECEHLLVDYTEAEHLRCASANTVRNDTRSAQIFKANQALVAAASLLGLAAVPFILAKLASTPLASDKPASITVAESSRVSFNERQPCLAAAASNRHSPAATAYASRKAYSRKHRTAEDEVKSAKATCPLADQR